MARYSSFLALALVCLSGGAHADGTANVASPGNPFNAGNVAVHLTPEQIADLAQYINHSQEDLQQALDDAKGMSLPNAVHVYLGAVKEVVIASYQKHPRTELLMRTVLNQALAFTYGIPSADGSALIKQGVLAQSGYRDLLPIILRQSIELALHYVDQDRAASNAGSLEDLPYAEVAYLRMRLSEQWMHSILEQDLSARFGIESLQQWLNVMTGLEQGEQLHQAKYAPVIDRVVEVLKQEEAIRDVGKQARLADITMRQVMDDMKNYLPAEVTRSPSDVACDPDTVANAAPGFECHVGNVGWIVQSENGHKIFYDTRRNIRVIRDVAAYLNFAGAQKSCPAGYRLPSFGIKDWDHNNEDPDNQYGEFITLEADGIRDVVPGVRGDHWFWSSCAIPGNPYMGDAYSGQSGQVQGRRFSDFYEVLCISGG